MNISELGYELYKVDWLRRITPDMMADSIKNYYEEVEDKGEYTFADYIFDNGYGNGCIYVCYEEFSNAEYLDEDYMKELFDNDTLFTEYQKDLNDNFYTD